MDVLSVTSEVYPLVKTGGLADVAGALPLALAGQGVHVRTLLPGYPVVRGQLKRKKPVHQYADLHGGKASILPVQIAGLDLFVLDAPHLFDRVGGPYGDTTGADWPDNARRFAALSRAGADIAAGVVSGYAPTLVHAHDWQAAMTLAYMRYGAASALPSVMTVHNLAFQGQFPASVFPLLGLPPQAMALDGVEYYGGVGFLKAGLQAASAITTVSPTYAQEIRTPEFGMGLDGLVNLRAGDLHGIVNGIDTGIWNPATDTHLAETYSARSLKGRQANKRAIEERFGLDRDDGPILCVVSRLTWQKGMDMLVAAIDALAGMGVRLAVLGAGDQALEGGLLAGAARHRGRVGVVIGYDEGLSHLMQGGSDAIVIPSRFEPCGLTQLYGLRYGCVPIVARTGGLADTIVDANEAAVSAGAATGFQFTPANLDAFLHAVHRALTIYEAPASWKSLQLQGMKADVSWEKSAARYAGLYRKLASKGHQPA
ncbi:starch synthase [Mesorhizobium albiziae]|uniref:Glycogen synthase n=1 Tax=Neomesorhizobium albiziae TaxID=335020 RepID=A0A1I4AFR9_9HYPH|nr:glycogen synthase GlgA [Mesorhizobium albiziae]GLS32833.1 glycogen synthase [Mesorhizobium albiziae]SFK55040.1 starch synthase [Mesorhizobium albiziae]